MDHRRHPLAMLLVKLGLHVAGHVLKKKFADRLEGKSNLADPDMPSRTGVRVRRSST